MESEIVKMFKKIIMLLFTLLFVAFQAGFIYVFSHGGKEQVETLWQNFGITPTAYSIWLLDKIHHKFMWLLPFICLCLGLWATWRGSNVHKLVIGGVLAFLTAALYYAVYDPANMVRMS